MLFLPGIGTLVTLILPHHIADDIRFYRKYDEVVPGSHAASTHYVKFYAGCQTTAVHRCCPFQDILIWPTSPTLASTVQLSSFGAHSPTSAASRGQGVCKVGLSPSWPNGIRERPTITNETRQLLCTPEVGILLQKVPESPAPDLLNTLYKQLESSGWQCLSHVTGGKSDCLSQARCIMSCNAW